MADAGAGRDQELSELLSEVRALRQAIDELKDPPSLAARLPPDYAVLARVPADIARNYEVLVRAALPFEQVVQPAFPSRSYEVLVRAPRQPLDDPPPAGS